MERSHIEHYEVGSGASGRGRQHPVRAGATGVLAVLAAVGGTLVWLHMLAGPLRLATGLLEARSHLRHAQRHLERGAIKDGRYETLLAGAASRRARAGFDARSPLLDVVSAWPKAGDPLSQTRHFVRAAELSARAAAGTLSIVQGAFEGPDALISKDPENPKESIVSLERVAEVGRIVSRIRADVAATARELTAVDLAKLPARIRPRITSAAADAAEADSALADAEAGINLLPVFLGADTPKTYLIGFQNSAELRGSGGALLQFAVLSIAEGKPTLNPGGTVYNLDKDRRQISIPLPADAWYVAAIPDAQRFGNANWSPHWPLSAQVTLDYAYASEPQFPDIDGVFAVDPSFMRDVLPGAGRYSVAGNSITSQRVIHFLLAKAYAQFPIPGVRRVVLRKVVEGFYNNMLSPLHPAELITGMGDALSGKHLQMWLADPRAQAFVERMKWDGGIRPAEKADYFNVVQQNVGGNKLDYFATQRNDLSIVLRGESAKISAQIAIKNGVILPQPRYPQGDSGPFHLPMVNVYVPAGAVLQRATAPEPCDPAAGIKGQVRSCRLDTPAPAAWSGDMPAEHSEMGKKVWSATLDIPPGATGKLLYDYVVPRAVRTSGTRKVYRLIVQHQPKVRPEDVKIKLELPKGARDIAAPGWRRAGTRLVWEGLLRRDMDFEVSWQS